MLTPSDAFSQPCVSDAPFSDRAWHSRCTARPNMRSVILNSTVGLIEDVEPDELPEDGGFSPDFQIALPYRGKFIWHVGHDHVVGDSRHVLFVTAGEAYRVTAARGAGCHELIITPTVRILAEIARRSESSIGAHPLFRRRSRNATQRLSALRSRLLDCASAPDKIDELAVEELAVRLLREAVYQDRIALRKLSDVMCAVTPDS
jgi:hypothetical protein